jgi:dipeptidyl aminopeptidase/acylaminoacyl peptidase
MIVRALLIVAVFAPFAVPAVGDAARPVTEDDYRSLVTLDSPAISPDGKRAVLVVSSVVWEEDRSREQLVEVDLATKARTTLVGDRSGLSGPAFSPDGTQLAFLANDGTGDDAHTQVFVLPVGGATAAQMVTHSKTDVEEFSWRPDGRALVYAAADPEPTRAGAERFRNSFVFTTEPIVAHSAPPPVHLFLLNLADNTSAQLTAGSESVADGSSLSWSPDGKTIAFTL